MKITGISYGKTINIGNYQSIRVEFTASVDPDEYADVVLATLKEVVKQTEEKILQENKTKK